MVDVIFENHVTPAGNGLGRNRKEDWNDLRFLATDVMVEESTRPYRYWNQSGWWGDQTDTPECVAYSSVHILEDGPLTFVGSVPVIQPDPLYQECKHRDGIPNEDGTYVRVAAGILKEQELIKVYRWLMNADEIRVAVLEHGPVSVGTIFTMDMARPDRGFVMHPTGEVLGGHQYVVNGYRERDQMFRVKNSWGRNWAKGGNAWISKEDLNHLIVDEQGDAMLFTER